MSKQIVSSCHDLKLIPVGQVVRFARFGEKVSMVVVGNPYPALEIPGSVKVSAEAADGAINKKITYECADVSAETACRLEMYKRMRLIAVYTDERGNRRVAGSPSCPLALDYNTDAGSLACSLTGSDTRHDAFLTQ